MIFPPISPCGRPVEYLRSCYRTQVRFFKDRPDILTPIIWYFTDRTDWIAWPHKFGSHNWDEYHPVDGCPVGEVGGNGTYSNGKRPPEAVDGPHPCGTPQQWAEGALFADAQVNPCQCGGPQGTGRLVQTGQGHFVSPWPSGNGIGRMVETGQGDTPTVDDGTGHQLEHGHGLAGVPGTGYMPETGEGETPTVDDGTGYMPETGDGNTPEVGGLNLGGHYGPPHQLPTGGLSMGGSAVVPPILPSGGLSLGGLGDEPDIPTTEDCDQCPSGAPIYWDTDGPAMGPDPANFTLEHASLCVWQFDLWTLLYDSGSDEWRLDFASSELWTLSGASWDCLGPNVMTHATLDPITLTAGPGP